MVLIIDDEKDFCLLMESYLKKRGYLVNFTHTLGSGLDLLQAMKPHILFLDNQLPDGQGWKLATHLTENYPLMKINLMSAYMDNHQVVPINNNVSFFEKPLSLLRLDELLDSFTYGAIEDAGI